MTSAPAYLSRRGRSGDHRRGRDAIELAAQRPGVVAAQAAQRVGHQWQPFDAVFVDALVEAGARDHAPLGVGGEHQIDLALLGERAQPLLHRLMQDAEIGRPARGLDQRVDQHRVGGVVRHRVHPLPRVDLEEQRRRLLGAPEPETGLLIERLTEGARRQQRGGGGQPREQRQHDQPHARQDHLRGTTMFSSPWPTLTGCDATQAPRHHTRAVYLPSGASSLKAPFASMVAE